MLHRLGYDNRGHFSNFDITSDEEMDYYDYSIDEPPGCSRAITPNFVLNSLPSNAPAKNVTVNKSAFWPNAYYSSIFGSINGSASGNGGLTVLPYICTPVATRVARSQGSVISLFPLAAIVVGCAIIGLAVLSAAFAVASRLVGCCRKRA